MIAAHGREHPARGVEVRTVEVRYQESLRGASSAPADPASSATATNAASHDALVAMVRPTTAESAGGHGVQG